MWGIHRFQKMILYLQYMLCAKSLLLIQNKTSYKTPIDCIYRTKYIYDVHSQLHPMMDVMRSAQPSSACGLEKKNGESVRAKSY